MATIRTDTQTTNEVMNPTRNELIDYFFAIYQLILPQIYINDYKPNNLLLYLGCDNRQNIKYVKTIYEFIKKFPKYK